MGVSGSAHMNNGRLCGWHSSRRGDISDDHSSAGNFVQPSPSSSSSSYWIHNVTLTDDNRRKRRDTEPKGIREIILNFINFILERLIRETLIKQIIWEWLIRPRTSLTLSN